MAAYDPSQHHRGRIADILGTADAPASAHVAPKPVGSQRIADILGVSAPYQAQGLSYQPVAEQSRWVEEGYIKSNTPWYMKALTSGPVGGFLNAIQKPLAFTTSAIKEGIDLFTGQDASWGDFTKQYKDNYTFGRLLHDYDVMQDRDSGWQKFGAAAVGFIGDVAFDPFSYLGLVGKGVAFGSVLARGGARNVTQELVRKSVLNQVRALGDDVVGAVGKSMKQGDWGALADDIARKAHHGGKKNLKISTAPDGSITTEWVSRVSRQGLDDTGAVTIKFADDEIADLERLMQIGAEAMDGGATAVAGDNLRFAGRMFADSGLDKNLRYGADDFVDELGQTIRNQVDVEADDIIKNFGGAWFSPGEADKLALSFGMKVPGTGPIGRALRINRPIEKIKRSITSKGLDSPMGIRFMTSEAPVIGKMVTGIPQGLRNGIIRQAVKAAGGKADNALLRRGGLTRLVTGGKLSGRMGDLKNAIRDSTDAVFVHQGKRLLHATGRGNSKARSAKTELQRIAQDFMSEVDAVGADYSAVYHAIAGDADAIALVGDDLTRKGTELFETLRTEAHRLGGRDFLGQVDNYVPRQLTDDARTAIREAFATKGKYSERLHKGRGKYKVTGPEMSRKYMSVEEFDAKVAERATKDGISVAEADKLLREEGDISGKFFGDELHTPGSAVEGGEAGEVWGSIEKQIMDITERHGGDYSLFVDDIEVALKGYVNTIAGRTGEVYTETLLFNEGILLNRMAEYTTIPTAEAVRVGRELNRATDAVMRAKADLMQAMNRQANNIGEPAAVAKEIEELEAVSRQADERLEMANRRQEDWYSERTRHEAEYMEHRQKVKDVDDRLERIQRQIDEGEGDEALVVQLEKERVALLDRVADLRADGASLRFSYGRLSSGTAQVLFMERAVNKIFGQSETFEAFVRDFGGFNPTSPNRQLDELAASGRALPEFVRNVDGRWKYITPDGGDLDIEETFMQLDGVLQQADEGGIGIWLGVERELDIMAANPKVRVGERVAAEEEGFFGEAYEVMFGGFDTGNAANKIDYMLKRTRLEIDEATRVLDEYAEFAPTDVWEPTPEAVVQAQTAILRNLDEGFANAATFDDLMNDPAMLDDLYTYHAGNPQPVRATLFDGRDLDEIVGQMESTMTREMEGVEATIGMIEEVAQAEGKPIRFMYEDQGMTRWATVRDYVMMQDMRNAMRRSLRTSQSPIDEVGVSIDDILQRGEFMEGPLGSNMGGKYTLDGKEYYVKEYTDEAADGVFVGEGNGRERVTGEVLSNALYRELSGGAGYKNLGAPNGYASRSANGSLWHVSPWIADLDTVAASGLDPRTAVIVTLEDGRKFLTTPDAVPEGAAAQTLANATTRGTAADLLLANWDVLGTGYDNIGISTADGLVRVDQGGTFFHRAQGYRKPGRPHNVQSTIENMLDPARPYGELVRIGIPDETSLTGVLGRQTADLLEMRARYGGMGDFVRRHMPGITTDQQQPYIDFLEERLRGMADYFGQEFHEAGSEEMLKATLAARGISEEVIEAAVKTGDGLRVMHMSSGEFINPLLRYGRPEHGWVDKPFLNGMPNGLTWGGTFNNPGRHPYNLVLETPMGARNIKVYGVHPDSEVRAAEIAMGMTADMSPDDILEAVEELARIDKHGYAGGQGMDSQAGGHMMLDQFARVGDADPEFFEKFIRVLQDQARDADVIPGTGIGRPGPHSRSVATIELAWNMGRIDIPAGAYEWNPNVPRAQMVQKLKDASFEERLRFAIWLGDADGAGRQGFAEVYPAFMDVDAGEVIGRVRLPSGEAEAGLLSNAVELAMKQQAKAARLGENALQDLPELYSVYLAKIDPNINPFTWAQEIAKNNGTLTDWAVYLDSLLYGHEGMMPKGTPATFEQFDRLGKKWFGGKFIHMYRRSLTADGYNGAVWFNDFDGGQAKLTMSPTGESLPLLTTDGTQTPFPNMMFTNPLALHSGDVLQTHRNLNRLMDRAPEVILDDLTEDAIATLKRQAQDLGMDEDALLPPRDMNEIVSFDPVDQTPITAGDEYAALLGRIEDPEDSPLFRGLVEAVTGESKYMDSAAFMDWWDEQAYSLMSAPDAPINIQAANADLLQDIAGHRAILVGNMNSAKGKYGATVREFNRAVREADAARLAAQYTPDEIAIRESLIASSVIERTAKMDRAMDTLARLGAGGDIPLENLPDDLIELRLAVGALIETDQKMLDFAMGELQDGADDWLELISQLPEGARDIHKIGQREEILDSVFRSGMKSFGELQGPATIVEAMTATERYVARGGADGFFRKYDKLHNLLRAYMIAKPGFHGRNFMSATFMNHLAGMNWSSYRRFMRAYWKHQADEAERLGLTQRAKDVKRAMRKRGINPDNVNPEHVEYVRQLADSGSLGAAGGQVATEFVETTAGASRLSKITPTIKIRGKKINLGDAFNPFSTRNAPLRLSRQFGMATETFVRGSLGFDTLLKGGRVDDAFDDIMKFHFDYDDLSDFERNVVKRVVPFYTWTRKNLPLMMEMMARKPQVFNRYMSLKKEIEMTTEGEPNIVPKWMVRQGAIQLPFKFEGEDMFILPDLPFKTPLELLDPAMAFDRKLSVGDRAAIALGSFGSMVTPLIKAPYEWKSKQNLWKGYHFDGKYEVVPRAYRLVPGLMPLLGAAGLTRKTHAGEWAMKDYELHTMAQLMPVFSDLRRLFPDETRYQERALSSWMSWAFGLGLRTNTRYEQEMERIRRAYDQREEISQDRSLRGATLR